MAQVGRVGIHGAGLPLGVGGQSALGDNSSQVAAEQGAKMAAGASQSEQSTEVATDEQQAEDAAQTTAQDAVSITSADPSQDPNAAADAGSAQGTSDTSDTSQTDGSAGTDYNNAGGGQGSGQTDGPPTNYQQMLKSMVARNGGQQTLEATGSSRKQLEAAAARRDAEAAADKDAAQAADKQKAQNDQVTAERTEQLKKQQEQSLAREEVQENRTQETHGHHGGGGKIHKKAETTETTDEEVQELIDKSIMQDGISDNLASVGIRTQDHDKMEKEASKGEEADRHRKEELEGQEAAGAMASGVTPDQVVSQAQGHEGGIDGLDAVNSATRDLLEHVAERTSPEGILEGMDPEKVGAAQAYMAGQNPKLDQGKVTSQQQAPRTGPPEFTESVRALELSPILGVAAVSGNDSAGVITNHLVVRNEPLLESDLVGAASGGGATST